MEREWKNLKFGGDLNKAFVKKKGGVERGILLQSARGITESFVGSEYKPIVIVSKELYASLTEGPRNKKSTVHTPGRPHMAHGFGHLMLTVQPLQVKNKLCCLRTAPSGLRHIQ